MTKEIDVDVVKSAVLEGAIGAISIDTCIFKKAKFGLEFGNLKQLSQFKATDVKLVMTDVVLREIRSHMVRDAVDAKGELTRALRTVGATWAVERDKREKAAITLFAEMSEAEMVDARIEGFKKATGAAIAKCSELEMFEKVLNLYFAEEPPFERREQKKAEFPDAFMLVALEHWAKERRTSVLLVTQDRGAIEYCLGRPAEEVRIYPVTDLAQALSLFQARNDEVRRKCEVALEDMLAGKYGHVLSEVEDMLANNIWDIDWNVVAHSSLYYEEELDQLIVVGVDLKRTGNDGGFRPVGYRDGALTVQAKLEVELDAVCNFYFSAMDGVDRDMVSIGRTSAKRQISVELSILFTFFGEEADDGQRTYEVEFELIRSTKDLDFGEVFPNEDQSDEVEWEF